MAKKKILIVEDQEELLKLETLLLTSRGYQVTGAGDGRLALSYLAEKQPDLVLLDVMLPEVGGLEVCQHIKSSDATRHIPVVMVTARNSREDMIKAEQAGADYYITKPFKSAVLMETVRRFLSGEAVAAPCAP